MFIYLFIKEFLFYFYIDAVHKIEIRFEFVRLHNHE